MLSDKVIFLLKRVLFKILNAFLSQQWLDKRLQYTPRVPFVTLPKEKRVWIPETNFMDAVVLHNENIDKHFTVRIYPSGNVLHVQKYKKCNNKCILDYCGSFADSLLNFNAEVISFITH